MLICSHRMPNVWTTRIWPRWGEAFAKDILLGYDFWGFMQDGPTACHLPFTTYCSTSWATCRGRPPTYMLLPDYSRYLPLPTTTRILLPTDHDVLLNTYY